MKTISEIARTAPVTVVEFYATWCPYCQAMEPVVKEAARRLEGRAPLLRFDIDVDEALSDEAGVEVVPTFIVYCDGKVYWTETASTTVDDILRAVDNALASLR